VAPLIQKDPAAVSYGCLAGVTRIHRDNATEGEERREPTPDLLLKHPNTTVATYV
jgi:hypothetical protein